MLPSYPYGTLILCPCLCNTVHLQISISFCTVPHTGLSLIRAVAMKLKSTTRLCVLQLWQIKH
uniref:Uncharacterized protein n=1 Tax=Anguilla anguilla TaxID=7936 RepID=A0A0E9Q3X0_ANGAN